MRLLTAVMALYILTISISGTDALTGSELLGICKDRTVSDASKYSCMGYLYGAYEGMLIEKYRLEADRQCTVGSCKAVFCPPNTIWSEQTILLFIKYAENHPEILHYPAAVILGDALAKAFPCAGR